MGRLAVWGLRVVRGGGRGEPETKDPPRGHYERAWDESDRRRRERGRGVMVIMVMVSEK